jgi:hypothetical protein
MKNIYGVQLFIKLSFCHLEHLGVLGITTREPSDDVSGCLRIKPDISRKTFLHTFMYVSTSANMSQR